MKKNYFKSLMQAAVLVCTPLVIASCDDVFGDTDNPIPAYMSIKQGTVNLVLHADKPDSATATRTAIAATGAEVVYSSTKPEIATVDAKTGVITAVNGGDCEIIAEVTGKDSNGRDTYQPQKASFKVHVTDWRARIALKEDAVVPVYNSAQVIKPIDMKELLDVWPALGTTGLNVTYAWKEKGTANAISGIAAGKISLTGKAGLAKVVAKIAADADVPKGYERKSFKDKNGNLQTDSLVIEVKEGVAYISGYNAKNEPDTTYMFKDYNNQKVTDLYTVLTDKGAALGKDAYLAAGWYYLDQPISFANNIRIKGDVNIILKDGATLQMTGTNNSIMDETAKQTYTLNIFPEPNQTGQIRGLTAIQDFKDVNIYGGYVWSYPTIKAVETVNIYNGKNVRASLKNIGTATIYDGYYHDLQTITSLNIKKGNVNTSFKGIGTATIENVAISCFLDDIKTLNFKKGTITGLRKIGTANIDDGTFNNRTWGTGSSAVTAAFNDVATLNFKKGTVNGDMVQMGIATISAGTFGGKFAGKTGSALTISDGTFNGDISAATVNISKGSATAKPAINSSSIKADLNVAGGTVTVNSAAVGIEGKITMSDGTLDVKTTATDKYAVKGDVEVTKGKFTAEGANYHAVDGKLIGTFFSSTTGVAKSWAKVDGETSTDKFIKSWNPDDEK